MAKAQRLEKDAVRSLIEAAFIDLRRDADRGFRPRSAVPEVEFDEQRELALRRISDLEDQVAELRFDRSIETLTRRRVIAAGMEFDALNAATVDDLLSGFARALAEQQRHYIHRLSERILPHAPVDGLFQAVPISSLPPSNSSVPLVTGVGPTMSELVQRYLLAKKTNWSQKTSANRTQQLRLLLDHVGDHRRAAAVTTDDMRAYRDGILRLRLNHHVGAGKSFASRQTENEAHWINPKTAAMLLDGAKALFRWALSEGFVKQNPAETIRVSLPKKVPGKKVRRPFAKHELEALFASAVWTGSKSLTRRYEKGDRVISDAKYWIPLIGFYTGMRLGEIVQLHFDDVKTDAEIPHIFVTAENCRAAIRIRTRVNQDKNCRSCCFVGRA